jgi:hypothetical protein
MTKTQPKHGAYKEICTFCKQEDYNDRNSRTTDNKVVCLHCQSPAQMHYRKGLLSSKEIQEYQELTIAYHKNKQELYSTIRKYSNYLKENPLHILTDVNNFLEETCTKEFKKVFACCSPEEKIAGINLVLNNFVRRKIPQKIFDELRVTTSNGDLWTKFNKIY